MIATVIAYMAVVADVVITCDVLFLLLLWLAVVANLKVINLF